MTSNDSSPFPHRGVLWTMLAIAVVGVSLAGPAIRFAEADRVALAFWRLLGSSLICGLLWLRSRREPPPAEEALTLRDAAIACVAGAFLALHFATWFVSLDHTSVAASVVLVNMQPVFAAVIARVALGERLSRIQWIGLAIAIGGALEISLPAWISEEEGDTTLFGNSLALVGAASGACYYVSGRFLRQRTSLWSYVTRVYGASAVALLIAALALGSRLWPLAARDWVVVAVLIVGPTMLGHTLLNWSLRWLSASAVNVVALGEPLGAAVFAWWIFAEIPREETLMGGGLVVIGILCVLGAARRPPRAQS